LFGVGRQKVPLTCELVVLANKLDALCLMHADATEVEGEMRMTTEAAVLVLEQARELSLEVDKLTPVVLVRVEAERTRSHAILNSRC